MTTPKVTGWVFTDARNFCSCSKCGAKPTEYCRTPKGRKAQYPHNERCAEYAKVFGIQKRPNIGMQHVLDDLTKAK